MSKIRKDKKSGQPMGGPIEKAKDFKVTLGRLLKYLKPHKINLIIVLLFAVLSMAFAIVSPKITGKAMNKLSDGYVSKMAILQIAEEQKSLRSGKQNTDVLKDPKVLQILGKIKTFPLIDSVQNPQQKAEIFKTVVELSQLIPTTQNIKFTQNQTDNVVRAINETNGKIDFTYIGQIILILLGIYLLSALFTFTMQYAMSSVAQKTVYDMRKDLNNKLTKLPLKYFDSRTHGEILSCMTNDIDTISNTFHQSLTQLITSMIQIIGYIIMMLITSPILTLIVMITMPSYILLSRVITKKSQKYFKTQQKAIGKLSGHVEEMYNGHKIVKAFGHEKESIEKFGDINDKLYEAGWKAQFVSGILFPLMNFISNLAYVAICVVGGLLMTANRLKLGDITAFIQYSSSFTRPIMQMANIANIIQSTIVCAERVFEVMDETEEIQDSATAKIIEFPKGEVKIENVDFTYKQDRVLIENMNIDVKQGHTIAIVGPTGGGKTTLVNLLMRFYEINKGKISIDGVDIQDIRRGNLRNMFGMVLQDTWLFNGTIGDNIAYGREGATKEEIVRAAKAAYAHHFITTLPEGYDTILNEEASNISQGQKQLLTIARAILADPAILILDEATSSIDTRTEILIQKAMLLLMKNRTSFVIAHRLSTIRDAELILVMNKGTIVEQGSHKELFKKGGFYAELYNSQFAGVNVEPEAV